MVAQPPGMAGQSPASTARMGFDAVVTLSADLLEELGLTEHGHAAEAAARRAVERLPGAVGVRIQWRGPLAGVEPPPLVSLHAIGSVAPAMGSALRALAELAQAMVRDALLDLARHHR